MKIRTLLSLVLAMAGLFAMTSPALAQHHGGYSGSGGHFGGGGGFHGGGNWGHHGYYHGHDYVNFYFGGFGYPYYGDPFFYPYGWGYGYAPYGFGYYGAPAPAYTYDPQGIYNGRVVSRGNRQLSVTSEVQEELARSGYYHGKIDGVMGSETRRAIRNYERARGLEVNGHIDEQLLSTMGLG